MKTISILGRDDHSEEHAVGYLTVGDRAKFFGKLGAFWGGLAGMLLGSAMMFAPVAGRIVVLGPLAPTLVGGLQGALFGGGLSALASALMSIGIPNNSVPRYETALKADKFLVVVHGGPDAVSRARVVLEAAGSTDVQAHAGTIWRCASASSTTERRSALDADDRRSFEMPAVEPHAPARTARTAEPHAARSDHASAEAVADVRMTARDRLRLASLLGVDPRGTARASDSGSIDATVQRSIPLAVPILALLMCACIVLLVDAVTRSYTAPFGDAGQAERRR